MSIATLEASSPAIRIFSRQAGAASAVPAPLVTPCSKCHLRDLCLPCGMTGVDVERLDSLMFGRRKVLAGQTLYREGDRFQFIYAVRSGIA